MIYIQDRMEIFCQECYEENFSCCQICENVYKNDELETIREQFICEYCKDEKYYKCEQCEELFIKEEVIYGPDNQICCSETCADKFTEQL